MKRKALKAFGLIVALAAVILALRGYVAFGGSEDPQAKETADVRRVPVALTPAVERDFENRVLVQGNVEAKNFATVSALVGGMVKAVFVDEGDAVVAGETKLFLVDDVALRKAVDIARQDLAAARCGVREAEANFERSAADLHKAEIDAQRFERLQKDGAVSLDLLESQQSRYKQTAAGHKYAESIVDQSRERERQAEAALGIAEKNLKDSLIYAPISGYVTMRFREPGEMAGQGDPMIRIDDPSVIEVSAHLPSEVYARVVLDQTTVRVNVHGVSAGEPVVYYKTPVINPQLRTFEIKCMLQNPPEGVVPGAMADLQVLLARRKGVGVPAAALQLRAGKDTLFTVKDNTAQIVEVQKGIETDGWVELVNGSLPAGTPVVTMGQYFLNEGSPVTVQDTGSTPADSSGQKAEGAA